MLRNQLALTEGRRANKKAITDGFSQFERLADMKELPVVEATEDEEDKDKAPIEKEDKAPIAKFNVEDFNRNLNNKETQDLLKSSGYNYLPSYYFDKNVSEISSLINDVNSDLEIAGKNIHNTALIEYNNGYPLARPLRQNPQLKTLNNIKNYKRIKHIYNKFKPSFDV